MLDIKLKFAGGHNDGREWMLPSPLRILFWNVTRACNLRCDLCFADAGSPDPDELSTEEAERMLRDAKAAGVREIVISGGEPFMREDLLEILAYASELGIGSRIASNGALLNDAVLARLRRETLARSFMVNLDTLDPVLYGELHGCPTKVHAAALNALRSIRDHGFHTTVAARVTPRALPGIADVVDRAAEEGWGTVSLQCPLPVGRAQGDWPAGTDILRLLEPVLDRFLTLPRHWLVEFYPPWARYHPAVQRLQERTEVAYVGCGAGRIFLVIQPSGRVVPCLCMDAPAARLGNVRQDDLGRIFRESPVCRLMRNPRAHGVCERCEEVATCGGGCRATALALTGRLDGPDTSCCLWRDRSSAGGKLNATP